MSIFDDPSLKLHYMLDVDVMYYQLAVRQLQIAVDAKETADTAERDLSAVDWYKYYVMDDIGDEIDFSVIEEELAVNPNDIAHVQQTESALRSSYALFFQSIAATHIFCSASLEAHINLMAQSLLAFGRLSRDAYDQFNRSRIRDKWDALATFVGVKGFDKGRQPYQGFVKLVNRRNALVHFHNEEKAPWYEIEGLIRNESIGLDIETGQSSLLTVKRMVVALGALLSGRTSNQVAKDVFDDRYFDLKWAYSG